MSLKQKLTGGTLALAALGGVGAGTVALASSANADSIVYSTAKHPAIGTHWSAHYGSSASCNANRSGVIRSVSRYAHVTYAGKCSYSYSGHYWTYGHITYNFIG